MRMKGAARRSGGKVRNCATRDCQFVNNACSHTRTHANKHLGERQVLRRHALPVKVKRGWVAVDGKVGRQEGLPAAKSDLKFEEGNGLWVESPPSCEQMHAQGARRTRTPP